MKIGCYAGSFPTMEEAKKATGSMIHGGVIQEQDGQFHVWCVNA